MPNETNVQTTLEATGQSVWSLFLRERNITANEAAALLCDEYLELEKSGALDLFLKIAEHEGNIGFMMDMDEIVVESDGKTLLTPFGCALYRFIKQQHPHVCHYARILSVDRDASVDMPKHINSELLQKIEQRYRAQSGEIRKLVADLMDAAGLEKIDPFELTDSEIKAIRSRVREAKLDREDQEKEERVNQRLVEIQNGGLFIPTAEQEEARSPVRPKEIFGKMTQPELACIEELSLKKKLSRSNAGGVLDSLFRKGLVSKETDIRYTPPHTVYRITTAGKAVVEYMLMQDDISDFLEGESGFVLMDDIREKAWRIRTRNMVAKELVAQRWTIEIEADGVDIIAEKDGRRHGFVISPKIPKSSQVRLIANRVKHFTFIVKEQEDVDASLVSVQRTARSKLAEATVITKLQASENPFAEGEAGQQRKETIGFVQDENVEKVFDEPEEKEAEDSGAEPDGEAEE